MNNLQHITLFNTPIRGSDIRLSIEPDAKALILTGYNGSGKSRTIGVLLESLALLRGVDHDVTSYDWVVELRFADNNGIRATKMATESGVLSGIKDHIEESFTAAATIEDAYRVVKDILEDARRTTKVKRKDNKQQDGFGCLATSLPDMESADKFAAATNVVAYVDSEIYFNYKREVSERVMSDAPTIDQTLYTLFYDLAVRQAAGADAFDKFFALMKDYEKISGKKSEAATKNYFLNKIKTYESEKGSRGFEDTEVFQELNKFFAQTQRRLRWGTNHAFMELSNGQEIPWVDFSKGEKTLLALLLITYLYGEQCIFLLDEPDLSLHMEWQRMLLPAMLRLAPHAQFIITTHSPFMIMNTEHEQVINMANFHQVQG
ncbi:AAA family ATPase [Pseudomonas sp. NPDC090755]|uniref:AAA family ATPase n=1 Tax=Pseudomonas sp. NPDC090755 TaxID=3364481 RepID=UPI00383BE9E1